MRAKSGRCLPPHDATDIPTIPAWRGRERRSWGFEAEYRSGIGRTRAFILEAKTITCSIFDRQYPPGSERNRRAPAVGSRGFSGPVSQRFAGTSSFLVELGDHGLRIGLHIILAAFAAEEEGPSFGGYLEWRSHVAQMVAAHRAGDLPDRQLGIGRR